MFGSGAAVVLRIVLTVVAAKLLELSFLQVVGGCLLLWIGLLVPHVARRLVGSDARESVPASLSLGALFGLLCDDLARTLSGGEIPLGIFTALFGATLFLALMIHSPRNAKP